MSARDYLPQPASVQTPPARTVDALCAVSDAVREALDKLPDTAPNGRDYVGDPARLAAAEREYARRVQVLRDLLRALEDDAMYYADLPSR